MGMNSVNLIGRLTGDLILNKTKEGKSVTNGTLAVDGYNDTTNFIRVVFWGRTAEIATTYCFKGSQIGVTGHIQTGTYDDKDGKKVYTSDVYVENLHLIGSKRDQETSGQSYQQQPYSNQPTQELEPTLDINSDDLPF